MGANIEETEPVKAVPEKEPALVDVAQMLVKGKKAGKRVEYPEFPDAFEDEVKNGGHQN